MGGCVTSTLRRWKNQHDEVIRGELKKIESVAALIFLTLMLVSLVCAVVFSKATGALFIPVMLVYCILYIIYFRNKSEEMMVQGNAFLSRSGLGASNAFYSFSWVFVVFSVFVFILLTGQNVLSVISTLDGGPTLQSE